MSATVANAADAPQGAEPTPLQRRGMRLSIIAQAFGCLGVLSFANGVLLLYLAKLGFGNATTMMLLATPWAIAPLMQMPLAWRADRTGLRRMNQRGTIVAAAGFSLIPLSGLLGEGFAAAGAVVGIIVFSVGSTMHAAAWFSLLSPLVPASMRGAYFGAMRVTWQLTGLAFGVACTFLLARESPLPVFHAILAVIALALAARVPFMRHLPELEAPRPDPRGMVQAIVAVARAPGYASFCCYAFLMTLVTANAPTLFVLVEREGAGFGDRTVIWMGNLLAVGSVTGFWLGGRLIDRLGTKPVFVLCHACFGAVFLAFLVRGAVPLPAAAWLGALSFAYGLVAAASSIAMSSEMLALIPPENKSLSTGLCTTLLAAGGGLSGLLNAGALSLGILSPTWTLAGATLTAFDTLLLIDAVLVVVLVVALGLVPSVMGRAAWAPKPL